MQVSSNASQFHHHRLLQSFLTDLMCNQTRNTFCGTRYLSHCHAI